ncbi:IS1182 family transposase, partial [Aerococcus sp. UMB9870]|nr:IS1182 family transposase [Aerococcus sp. UMB9870]
EKYAERLKVTSREYYFNEIQPMVDAGIQYDENLDLEETMLQEISKVLKEEIDKLTEDIEETPVKGPDQRKQERRRLKKHYRKVSKDFLPRKQKYAKQFETFNGRNSYSKT